MCSIFPNKCTHSEFWVRSKRKKSRRDERKSRDKSREEWSVQCSPIGITITLRMSFSIKASAQRYIHFKTVIIQPRFKKKENTDMGDYHIVNFLNLLREKLFPINIHNHFKTATRLKDRSKYIFSYVTFSAWVSSILQTVDQFWEYVNSRSDRQKYRQIYVKVNILKPLNAVKTIQNHRHYSRL